MAKISRVNNCMQIYQAIKFRTYKKGHLCNIVHNISYQGVGNTDTERTADLNIATKKKSSVSCVCHEENVFSDIFFT